MSDTPTGPFCRYDLVVLAVMLMSALPVTAIPGWTAAAQVRSGSVADGRGGAAPSEVAAARVERMLEQRLACRGCHVIAGRGGRIGPPLDGIGERTDYAHVLRVVQDPAAALPGTLMPGRSLAPRDAERLAAYIAALPPVVAEPTTVTARAPATLDPADANDGAALYARHCAACHGDEGGGDGWNAAALPVAPTAHADAALMALRADDTLFDAIYAGGWVLDRSALMPAFGRLLRPEQIRALVAHIRTLCACSQPAWAGVGR